MTRPQDILIVLKIQALSSSVSRASQGLGSVIRSARVGYGDDTNSGDQPLSAINEAKVKPEQRDLHLKDEFPLTFSSLGQSIGISASQAHSATKRAKAAGLLNEGCSVRKQALFEALLGIKYFMPAKQGGLTRGIPTAHSAPPINTLIASTDELPVVWPHPDGFARGIACDPIYKTAPPASILDAKLYEYLALVDSLRIGRAREVNLARAQLEAKLKGEI